MAEEKKDIKKDIKPVALDGHITWEEITLLILGVIALLFVFIPRLMNKDLVSNNNNNVNSATVQTKSYSIKDTYNKIFNEQENKVLDERGRVVGVTKTPSLVVETKSRLTDLFQTLAVIVFSSFIFLVLLFSIIIYYNKFRRELIVNSYKKKFETEEEIKAEEKIDENNEKILETIAPDTNGILNPRWEIVGRYYNSANQSDWKLAIVEADIMLYEVLNKSGFPGLNIGEMLKNADKSKLNTLDEAWSAHKVRNEIAHSGTDYVLSRDLVKRTISQYEKVFDELNYI